MPQGRLSASLCHPTQGRDVATHLGSRFQSQPIRSLIRQGRQRLLRCHVNHLCTTKRVTSSHSKKATFSPRFGLRVARGRKVAHLIIWVTFRPRATFRPRIVKTMLVRSQLQSEVTNMSLYNASTFWLISNEANNLIDFDGKSFVWLHKLIQVQLHLINELFISSSIVRSGQM